MKFIIKLFPEIIIKSKPVRKRLIGQLKKNLKKILSPLDESIVIAGSWDFIEVRFDEKHEHLEAIVLEKLKHTPGIDFILKVKTHAFETLDDIAEIAVREYAELVKDKTFCVRVKRSGRHPFNSIQAEQKAGGALLHNSESAGVKLKQPEVTVQLEIKQEKLYTIESRTQGLGGFPMGQQESCVSLISGGYDSSVASYLMMKRGIRTHFCFFNLGGIAHEVGVKQVSHYLWEKYSSSHRVLFITIPFENVVNEILTKVHHSQMGVVLKRMMLRVAEKVALEFNAPGLVTGECVGQVSSQTLTNLAVIDKATDFLTMRPLITMDKQDIIALSKQTGTEEFAAVMPEYCGVISDKPTTCAKLHKIEAEESNFDFEVLEQAFTDRKVENIDALYQSHQNLDDIEVVKTPAASDVVIDIRHPQELAIKPLVLTKNNVLPIPFFKLQSSDNLNKDETYLLYCDKGIMSQLQAEELSLKGYKVKVYQP
ncbi:tRNA uracil 4-sulfurtransferase ThiI [Aliikangiella coralliicola]|uniref:Probable tRNA sulfurtransferase n=1 Tax=Aliikangiella coralliicola TaxID=2592383 RepID=A0A545U0J4_9GAMM|nr:tRNA uracil 4-sulfurtransferase ThiI [Aliikangiella coralliicola]TQV82988.1 tRNA 4-thiouridine(8) synthase ThiI [Aliikangiella coralliicola]